MLHISGLNLFNNEGIAKNNYYIIPAFAKCLQNVVNILKNYIFRYFWGKLISVLVNVWEKSRKLTL